MNNNAIDICNYPILDNLKPSDKEATKQSKDFNYICYVGGITKKRGIQELVQALQLTKNKVILNLAGDFTPKSFEHELKNLPGWKHVKYLGYLSKDQVHKVYFDSLIGIATLHPTPAYINSLPVKIFEYMSYKLPVIASDFDYFKAIFFEIKCGFNVNPNSPKDIAKAIDDLIDNPIKRREMAENGYKAIINKFNWYIEEIKLLKLYKDLVR